MNPDSNDQALLFPSIATDLLSNVLSRANRPCDLGDYVAEQVRELTGARCVMLIQCPSVSTGPAHRIVGVNPVRDRERFESPMGARLAEAVLHVEAVQLWRADESSQVTQILRLEGFESSMVLPLNAQEHRVGAILVLGIPDEDRITPLRGLLNTLASVVALALRNAELSERQEQLVEERATELRESNAKLAGELAESKKAEKAWHAAYEYTHTLISLADVMIVGLDAAGRIKVFNQAAEAITGYTIEELAGTDWFEKLVPRDRYPDVWKTFCRHQEDGVPIPRVFENPILTRSGEERVVSWRNTAISTPGADVSTISFGIDITERVRAETALSAERRLFAAGPVVVFKWKAHDGWPVEYVSPNVADQLGYTAEELTSGKVPYGSIVHADDLARVASEVAAYGEHGIDWFEQEYRIARRDGACCWVHDITTIIRNEEGGITNYLGYVRDITARKRAEQALRESEERYRSVVENTQEAFYRSDVEGNLVMASPSMLRSLGYSTMAEVLGKPIAETFYHHPEKRAELLERVQKAGSVMNYEVVLKRRNGAPFVVETSTHFYYDESGNVAGVEGVFRDVSERKQAEEALRDGERRLSALVNFLPDATIAIDKDRRIIIWNRAAEEMTGIPAHEVIGKGDYVYAIPFYGEARPLLLDLILGPDDQMSTRYPMLKTEGDNLVIEDFCPALYDGKGAYVWAKASPLRDSDGQIVGAIECLRDITVRKQAEGEIRELNAALERRVLERTAQLEAANRELEAFAYSVSHDLRAPLRGIDGFSLAILEDYAAELDETAANYLHRVRAASQRMAQLIDDMLRLSRVTRGEMRMDKVDLSGLAQEIANELAGQNPERRVIFAISPEVTVTGDANLLRIALENLLGNAWKFTSTRAEARIEFGVSDAEDRPVYFVRDNGAGFDMKYVSRLFGAFQRLHATNEFPGSGIGLATVQRIIHRHGGRVWAEGAVDQGAMFCFVLQ